MSPHKTLFDAKAFQHKLATTTRPLLLFRETLSAGREHLKALYKKTKAEEMLRLHTWLIDQILNAAWDMHQKKWRDADLAAALVAVGGYGRRELHPYSDIDITVLLAQEPNQSARHFIESLMQFLWDIGLEVGHSVRPIKSCAKEAKSDVTIATNLMEARLLCGDPTLFKHMQTHITAPKLWPSKSFFAAKLAEQAERHKRYGDTAYELEPNIKENPGGLRDVQTILWVAQRHFGANAMHELVEHDFLNDSEHRALRRGLRFLWTIRMHLHYLAGRREDRLLFDHQREVAKILGFRDKPGALAVEQFMKQYYRVVKELSFLNTMLLQHFSETILGKGSKKNKDLNSHFSDRDGYLAAKNKKIFQKTPIAALELFVLLQKNPRLRGVHSETLRALHIALPNSNRSLRADPQCRAHFIDMLREPRHLAATLRLMNAYGVLGRYLPVFGRIVGQSQHDLFHAYTVDEHTLFVLGNVTAFHEEESKNTFPLAAKIITKLKKPERLHAAALFHDIAKGRGGDHSEIGEGLAKTFCREHNMSAYDGEFVAWLVRHHLLMSWTAQREDIDDINVVTDFAKKIGTQEHLDNLYLLTVADIRGTSPKLWNTWKDHLLTRLYSATQYVLQRGFDNPIDIDEHVKTLKKGALEILREREVPTTNVQNLWKTLGRNYFVRYDELGLAWHAEKILKASAQSPTIDCRYQKGLGGTEVLVYTPDQPDLFVTLMGAISRLHLNVVDARIHTSHDDYALDTFTILSAQNEPIKDKHSLREIKDTLRAALNAPHKGKDWRKIVLSRRLKHFPIEPKVIFNPHPNGKFTVMQVTAQDRPGLLYQVAIALQETKTNLVTAKVSTYGERAEDFFFITTQDLLPIDDATHLAQLEQNIVARLTDRPTN